MADAGGNRRRRRDRWRSATGSSARGHEKAALAQRIDTASHDAPIGLTAAEVRADDVVWRRVEVSGRFEPKYAVLIDNRIVRGAVGYYVVMPLKIEGSERYVLVNRGWVAGTGSRGTLPQIATPAQTVRITGLATAPSKRYLELSTKTVEGNVWQNLTLERYRATVPIALQPVVIQQDSKLDDGLDTRMERAGSRHRQALWLRVPVVRDRCRDSDIYIACNVRKNA